MALLEVKFKVQRSRFSDFAVALGCKGLEAIVSVPSVDLELLNLEL